MYDKIVNPKTNRKVSITTPLGKKIIEGYKKKLIHYTLSNMSEDKQKFCRCVLHVATKNTANCLRTRKWGKKCYNPYSICADSVNTTTGGKSCEYDFRKIPITEIKAYVNLQWNKYNKWYQKHKQDLKTKSLRYRLIQWYQTEK